VAFIDSVYAIYRYIYYFLHPTQQV